MSVGPCWATWVSLGKLPEISIGAPSVRVSPPGIPCPGPEWQMEVTVTFDQMGLSCIFYMDVGQNGRPRGPQMLV